MRLLRLQRQIGLQSDPILRIASNRFGRTSLPRAYETTVRKQGLQKLVSLPRVAKTRLLANSSLEIMMPNPVHQNDVQITRVHSGAVCEEIGERLSAALGPQSNELSPRLLALIKELGKVDPREAPRKFDGI